MRFDQSDPSDYVSYFVLKKISSVPFSGWERFIGTETPAVIEGEGIYFVDKPGRYTIQTRFISKARHDNFNEWLDYDLKLNDKVISKITFKSYKRDFLRTRPNNLTRVSTTSVFIWAGNARAHGTRIITAMSMSTSWC